MYMYDEVSPIKKIVVRKLEYHWIPIPISIFKWRLMKYLKYLFEAKDQMRETEGL